MKTEVLSQIQSAKRIIGLVPRIKRTADGKPSPTTVAIWDTEATTAPIYRPQVELEDEQDELDFVLGVYPVRMRAVVKGEDLSGFREHHIAREKETKVPVKVPSAYEGLKQGDVIVLSLGGSGDNLSFALSRHGEKIGALVLRCPPSILAKSRNEHTTVDEKESDDSKLLVELLKKSPEVFYPVFVRERDLTYMRECLRVRIDAMKARIACEQRLRQRFIGKIFCNPDGLFPEGAIEKAFDGEKTTDAILLALEREELTANQRLEASCKKLEVYRELFAPITGVGPAIASRLISSIQDIRRFETKWKLRKFCGVHCMDDGRFPRRRSNELANWNPDARQALYLLADQFNRRPDTKWGEKLKANKGYYRLKHPAEVVCENGKKKYTKAHIHKMGIWKTLGEFVEWLFEAWWELERKQVAPQSEQKAA